MMRGAGMPWDSSSPALLLVWIGHSPKLPFSVLYHTRADVEGWCDP